MQGENMSIDFVSTRSGVDVQSQNCAKLISAVIAQALKDLMEKPAYEERIHKINLNKNAIRSIYFFNSETFINYAAMVGFDGKEFLERIIVGGTTTEHDGEAWVTRIRKIPVNYISEMELRTIRARLRWRCSEYIPLLPTTEEDIADEASWDEAERLFQERRLRALEKKEKIDAKRKNNNGEGSISAANTDGVRAVHTTGGDKVAPKVSTAKRRNAKAS
jgi:hypothetical protein